MTRPLLIAALLAGLALPALAADPQGQGYSFALPQAITTLDPQKSTAAAEADIIRQVFEGLMNADANGKPVPGVATGFDLSPDRLTYTFHLRPDAAWSNGDPVTAGDFTRAWRRLADPATGSAAAGFIEMMHVENASAVRKGKKKPEELGVTALDDRTLQVRLTRPTPYFPKLVSHVATFPIHAKIGDNWTKPGKLIGNGAYLLQALDPARQVDLAPNPRYWGAADVTLTHLQGQVISEPKLALERYRAGKLDRAPIPVGQYLSLDQQAPDQAVALPRACTYAYLLNLGDKGPKALKDARLRQALSHALPRDEVVGRILQGGQKPARTWTHWAIEGFHPPALPDAGWSEAQHLDRARALLAEAGHSPEKPLKLTLTYNSDPVHKQIASAVQAAYRQIGIELTLESVNWKQQADRLQSGAFDLARYSWCADYDDASSFLDLLGTEGRNFGQYASAEFDRLLAQARTSDDPGAQYTAAEAILAQDMPLIPVYHYAAPEMIRDDIRGLPTGNALDIWYGKDLRRGAK